MRYRLHFPDQEAGIKTNAWSWYGSKKMSKQSILPEYPHEVWFTQPSHRAETGDNSLLNAIVRAGQNRIVMIGDDVWHKLTKLLNVVSNKSPGVRPTTGLSSIAMAICRKPEELTITGFDATTANKPGWGDNVPIPTDKGGSPDWRDIPSHDHVAEKIILADLVYHRQWLGNSLHGIGINWIRLD